MQASQTEGIAGENQDLAQIVPCTQCRDSSCPICGSDTELLLKLSFGRKLNLPITPELRICAADNFAFTTQAAQSSYNEYYNSVVNDYWRETSEDRNSLALLQMSK